MLLKAQGGVLSAAWVETGPFEPCSLYRLIVQLWLCPSAVMSQHSREQINVLVLEQMSSMVKTVCNSRTKGTSIAMPLFRQEHSPEHLHSFAKMNTLKCNGQ